MQSLSNSSSSPFTSPPRVYSLNYAGKSVTFEFGKMARQADGSVLVSCEGTQVLVTACSSREMKEGQDFFPLMVDYIEKFYSAGKFLGGFLKREGRPSTHETLVSRLIDRPLRPLFPEGYLHDTVINCTVLSYSEKGDSEVLAGLGAAAALAISDIPFKGPLGMIKVGRVKGEWTSSLNNKDWTQSDVEVLVAATDEAILMLEGECAEISEEEMLQALKIAHQEIKNFCSFLKEIEQKESPKKRSFVPVALPEELLISCEKAFSEKAHALLEITDKKQRSLATAEFVKEVSKCLLEKPSQFVSQGKESLISSKTGAKIVEELLYKIMRRQILKEGKRIGGRSTTQVRPIYTEVDTLHAPHGSALFTRGETQVLASVTIGGLKDEQMVDRIVGQSFDRFYLHYNFPGYSVGEAKGKMGVSRRELGHGNLAQRALKRTMPPTDTFPYTVRVVCEVLESNGSSSMGSVCSGSLGLMAAGIPVVAPAAGIAMGLISDGQDFKILSDILGDEDHLGDMDFKVAGTAKGITAIQMDIKIAGLSWEIMEQALKQAKEGRLHILHEMSKTLEGPRSGFRPGVPLIESFPMPVDKFGMLIGPGGKTIKALQEQFKVTIECLEENGGVVRVMGVDPAMIQACIRSIRLQLDGPVVGENYLAKVVSIKEYGAFLDIAPGVSGLVHVSEFANERVQNPEEYLSIGEEVLVKVTEIDSMGRIKLSAKQAAPLTKKS